ncbi:4'-phosphopantetheinyl transferase superfamily protein [Asanoa sp. WMMD1127]|uniref:4'-phosphopantetheinyl transferase family protein n=1 Tax=Asanoa sp. WMMD1127 TaxID=3016107 RepID=UPI0024167A7D|nr:4'-phosphopantetheinyl transferase superfamily protein [Asanoa sp. WMMD1127]MDG4825216.1 4'-phosphopantetheinyl transferase superfamily protein [Asanoa sp. WMMD1127]
MEAWVPTTTVPALPPGTCQVWWARPSELPPDVDGLLGADDLARRSRLRRGEDRDRLTTAWALARVVLSHHVGPAARDLRFERTCRHCGGPHGKPRLIEADAPLLSLSHAGDRVAVAVLRGAQVGVDVESLAARVDIDTVAGSVLSGEEARALARTAADDRRAAFLTYWTRKEAVLKATGDGLRVPMTDLTVSGPGQPPRLRDWTGAPDHRVDLYGLRPGAGYLACLATVDSPPVEVVELAGAGVLAGAQQ